MWLGDGPQVAQGDKDDELRDVLIGIGNPATADEIMEVTGERRSTLQRRLKDAVERATIVRSGSGNRNDPFRYFV